MSITNTGAKAVGIYKFVDLGGKIGIGVLIGMLLAVFACGTKQGSVEHIYHTDTVSKPAIHDTSYKDRWHSAEAHNLHGVAKDSSACPLFDIWNYPIGNDTLTLIDIDAKNQTIGLAFYMYRDSLVTITEHDTKIITVIDSVIIHEVAKVKGLGYHAGAFVSTERFGAVLDGYYENYHVFFAPRIRYLDPGNVWQKLGAEFGVQVNFLP